MANEFIQGLNKMDQLEVSGSEKLRKGIISHTKVIIKDLAASAVFLNEYRYLSKTYLREFLLLKINYIDRFKQFIEQGMKEGEFGGIDKKMTVMVIFSSLNWIPGWYEQTNGQDREYLSNQLANLLIYGLKNE